MSDWNNRVKRILKSELVKRGLTTEDLTNLLNEIGCSETKSSVDCKICRGTFSATFFIQCLYVMGCTKIEMADFHYTFLISRTSNLLVAESTVEYKDTKAIKNEY